MADAIATKGPWKVSTDVPDAIVAVDNDGDNLLGLDPSGYAIVMNPADARLMAAAPEMLQALKSMRRTLDAMGGGPMPTFDEVIAKAEGRTT